MKAIVIAALLALATISVVTTPSHAGKCCYHNYAGGPPVCVMC